MASEVIAGRYRLERRLGGGMSEVWAAIDLDLERTVAIKLLAPHADAVRFEREARAVAALAHPNICTLYSYGATGGRPFMVFEYLPRGSLEDRLAEGRRPSDGEAARVAAEIAAGLAHAHVRDVVHRDLKPSNILFDAQDRAKIADFGIALVGEQSGLTQAGTVFGTAAYLSPEQAAGEQATPASDVYAFGVILFRMLTGRLPFEAEDALAMAAMHRERPAPSVASIRPDAPPRLESIAAAALAKSPSDRPRDGASLVNELAGGGRAPAEATAVTQVLRPVRGKSRTAAILVAAAILATAGIAVAIAVTVRGGTKPMPTTSSEATTTSSTSSPVAPVTPPPPESTAAETTATEAQPTTSPAIPTTLPATTAPPPTTVPPSTAVPPATTAALPPPPTTTAAPPVTTLETIPTDTATTTAPLPATSATTTEPAPPASPG